MFINSKESPNGAWLLKVLFGGDFSMRMVRHFDVTVSFFYTYIWKSHTPALFCSSSHSAFREFKSSVPIQMQWKFLTLDLYSIRNSR